VAKKQWAASFGRNGLEARALHALRPWQIDSEAVINILFEKQLVWTVPMSTAAFGSFQLKPCGKRGTRPTPKGTP
jgi:hypothetical protein